MTVKQIPSIGYVDSDTIPGNGTPSDPFRAAMPPVASSPPQIVVYAPGLVAPVAPVYATWAEVETAVNAVQGACQLWVDQTGLGGFAQVPATANLDGRGRLEIVGKGPQGEAELQIADGGQIQNVQTWRTIVVRAAPNARPALLWNIDGMIVECYDATFLFGAAATAPVMQLDPAISYISFFFSDSSELRNSHNPGNAVLDLGTNPGALCLLSIDTLFFPSSFNGTIGGIVGQTLQIQTDSSVPPGISFPGFLGTLTQANIDQFAPAQTNAFTDPTVGAAYTEDFESLQKVTVVVTAGGVATLRENEIANFVGDVGLQSLANGDAVAVNTSQSKLFMDLGAGVTTFRARVQPPGGPLTGAADADIAVGMIQGFLANVVGIGTFFQAGFGVFGNTNWWAVNTNTGDQADTGVSTNTGGGVQSFQIVYTPGVSIVYSINGVVVATFAPAGASLAVGLQAKWHCISRGNDEIHVDYLSYSKSLPR